MRVGINGNTETGLSIQVLDLQYLVYLPLVFAFIFANLALQSAQTTSILSQS